MNKQEFFKELSSRLSLYPQSEIEKSIAYYDEIISDRMEDGMQEEEAVEALGNIDEIAKNVMLDMPLPAIFKSKITESQNKSQNKGIWIALVIIGAPLWLPLLLAACCVVFAVYICIWSVIISLYAVELSLAVAAIGCFIGGIVLCFRSVVSTGLCSIGASLVCASLALFMFKPLILISKGLIKLTVCFGRKVKSIVLGKGALQNEEK